MPSSQATSRTPPATSATFCPETASRWDNLSTMKGEPHSVESDTAAEASGSPAEFIDAVGWRPATSPEYQLLPHEYTVRVRETAGKPPIPEWFDWFAALIRTDGYKAKFTNPNTNRTYTYRYLDAQDGQGQWHKYWHMGVVINREPLPE